MGCCHADFAALEGSDRGFTLGMPTFTFGSGVLAEAGDRSVERLAKEENDVLVGLLALRSGRKPAARNA